MHPQRTGAKSVMQGLDARRTEVCFDIGHATVEGGLVWPVSTLVRVCATCASDCCQPERSEGVRERREPIIPTAPFADNL